MPRSRRWLVAVLALGSVAAQDGRTLKQAILDALTEIEDGEHHQDLEQRGATAAQPGRQ